MHCNRRMTPNRLILICASLVLAFNAVSLAWRGPSTTLSMESRDVRPWPAFINSPRRFLSEAETAMLDRMALREAFIRAISNFRYFAFNNSSTSEVTAGRDGWLFFGDLAVKEYTAGKKLPVHFEEQFTDAFEKRLKAIQIPYVFAIAPNKGDIYPEYLPGSRAVGLFAEEKLIQNLERKFPNHVLNAFRLLRGQKANPNLAYPLYFRDDPHWSFEGAGVFANEVLKMLSPSYSERDRVVTNENIEGAFARNLGLFRTENARFHRLRMAPETVEELIRPLPFGSVRILKRKAAGPKKLLVVCDSYIEYLHRFLVEDFDQVFIVKAWQTGSRDTDSGPPAVEEFIDEFKPDAVLILISARNFPDENELWRFDPRRHL